MMKQQTTIYQRNEALCRLRRRKNWTQHVAAKICEVTLFTYKAWEQGTRRPNYLSLWRISEVFEAPVSELGYELREDEKEMLSLMGAVKSLVEEDPPLSERELPEDLKALQMEIAARAAERRMVP